MRLERKNRDESSLGIMNSGGIMDLFDNEIKSALRINDKEYDFLCEKMSDVDMDLLLKDNSTFTERKAVLLMVEGHLENFKTNN